MHSKRLELFCSGFNKMFIFTASLVLAFIIRIRFPKSQSITYLYFSNISCKQPNKIKKLYAAILGLKI